MLELFRSPTCLLGTLSPSLLFLQTLSPLSFSCRPTVPSLLLLLSSSVSFMMNNQRSLSFTAYLTKVPIYNVLERKHIKCWPEKLRIFAFLIILYICQSSIHHLCPLGPEKAHRDLLETRPASFFILLAIWSTIDGFVQVAPSNLCCTSFDDHSARSQEASSPHRCFIFLKLLKLLKLN